MKRYRKEEKADHNQKHRGPKLPQSKPENFKIISEILLTLQIHSNYSLYKCFPWVWNSNFYSVGFSEVSSVQMQPNFNVFNLSSVDLKEDDSEKRRNIGEEHGWRKKRGGNGG